MPINTKQGRGPSGYRLFARGILTPGSSTVTNGFNVSSASAPSAGKYVVTLASAPPTGAVVMAEATAYVPTNGAAGAYASGGISGANVSITTETMGGAMIDSGVYFEVWAP